VTATAAPKVYSIAAGLPFLDVLADGILARCGASQLALSEAIVLLPTRRACRALRDAFLRRAEGAALLLPRIQPLGDVDDDEAIADAALATAADAQPWLETPPSVDPIRRQLTLARLIRERAPPDQAVPPAQALALADALGRLLDQVATEQANLAALTTLVPEDFAQHWQVTLDFLAVLTKDWPRELERLGAIDRAERRNRLLAARTARWGAAPPTTPVIAAGSTGSIPATAALLAAVSRLPAGAVVLPGLDRGLDDDAWEALAPSHPQHALKQLLDRIGIARTAVPMWNEAPPAVDRTLLLREALRPAHAIAAPVVPDRGAFADLRWIESASPQEEAVTIAVVLREALETPGRTAALVTPDRALARRVAAELKRWNVAVDDSGGTPLAATRPGVFLRLIAEVAVSAVAPIPLLALLKHPLAAGGMASGTFRARARALERAALRGSRPAPGFAGLRAAVAVVASKNRDLALPGFVDALAAAFAPLAEALSAPQTMLASALAAHIALAERLAADDADPGAARLWADEAGSVAADLAADVLAGADSFSPFAGTDYAAIFEALLAGAVVRPAYGTHPRLSIWGPLEARLQSADLLVLGGLNEGTWPPEAPPDPWLSRPMRVAMGLAPLERRIGQSAHDFAALAAASSVILSRATKVDGMPTVPARWLLRLKTVAKATALEWGPIAEAAPRRWALGLDTPARIEPRPAPSPRPPLTARPTGLSVTRVETWLRDPYSIYARYVLDLRKLDPIDASPGGAERGRVIHLVLERFLVAVAADPAAATLDRLLALGTEVFAEHRVPPAVVAFWWPRFERIARWFIDREQMRRATVRAIKPEAIGKLTLPSPAGPFTLTAKADRIDILRDASLEIIDYKTGQTPSAAQVHGGWSPQLPLEALIAEAGGFEHIAAARVGVLAYWRLTGADPPGEAKDIPGDLRALFAATRNALDRLIAAFGRADTAYHALPRPHPKIVEGLFTDYDHLARVDEWSDLALEDGNL